MVVLLTKTVAEQLLAGATRVSLDLERTTTTVTREDDRFLLGEERVPEDELRQAKPDWVYRAVDGKLEKVELFSQETNRYYKLLPTSDLPTATMSSTPMHRHTRVSPKEDTRRKLAAISPVRGRVLDCCTGLGYTAIGCARTAQVVTIEVDPNMVELQKINPWSSELFTNRSITRIAGDVLEEIRTFSDAHFDRICHDPPTFKYAPELYSGAFYRELFRVLAPRGILYHYCPAPGKMSGKNFARGVLKRLRDAGFRDVRYNAYCSGVIARP